MIDIFKWFRKAQEIKMPVTKTEPSYEEILEGIIIFLSCIVSALIVLLFLHLSISLWWCWVIALISFVGSWCAKKIGRM